jgi:hypothetical protein
VYAPETITPGSTMRWMGSTGEVELYTRTPGLYKATFSLVSYARPRRVRIEGRRGTRVLAAPLRQTPRSVLLSLPRGRSSVRLTADPGAQPLPDGREASVYLSNWRLSRATGAPLRQAIVPQAEPAP